MKTVEKKLNIAVPYDLRRIGDPETLLFFDIETTGFSPSSSMLYLIGCLYFRGGEAHFVQWLACGLSEETEVLGAFLHLASGFGTLVHYNGDTFDLRYLQGLADQYRIVTPFDRLRSFDILKKVRAVRTLLQLENCRLKTVERFLGICREDLYSGGELIDVYREYLESRDPGRERLLLLHNEEDILNLPGLLPVLEYADFLNDPAFADVSSGFSEDGTVLQVSAETPYTFPCRTALTATAGIRILLEGHRLLAEIPVTRGTMKTFYQNYRDYYYLPEEDTAIHKRLAQYVDKPHRVPATPRTACTRVTGVFLPARKGLDLPVFTEDYKTGAPQVLYREEYLPEYLAALVFGLRSPAVS